MQYTRHALLIGLGEVGNRVLNAMPSSWNIDVLDHNAEVLAGLPDSIGGQPIRKFQGDACNRLILEQTGITNGSIIAVMTDSDETNSEIVRVIRNHFEVEEIVCLQRSMLPPPTSNQPAPPSVQHADLRQHNGHDSDGHHAVPTTDRSKGTLSTLYTNDIVASAIRGEMIGDVIASSGIGLGKGEVRQVTVLGSSAAIGQRALDLTAKKWMIAAVFRNNELILPAQNPTFEKGDTVLVVGDPEILEHEVAFLRGGEIVFPNQYGQNIGAFDQEKCGDELNWLLERSNASRIVPVKYPMLSPEFHSEAEIRNRIGSQNIGILAIPPTSIPWLSRIGFRRSNLKQLLLACKVPVLIARNKAPYRKILLAVSKKETAAMISTVAIDLARQCEANISVLTVIPPNAEKSDSAVLEKLPAQVVQIARVHGIEMGSIIDEGNPIQKIREHAQSVDLLVIGHSPMLRSSFFRPDVSLHILHDCPSSVLFVPWNSSKVTSDADTASTPERIIPLSHKKDDNPPAAEETSAPATEDSPPSDTESAQADAVEVTP